MEFSVRRYHSENVHWHAWVPVSKTICIHDARERIGIDGRDRMVPIDEFRRISKNCVGWSIPIRIRANHHDDFVGWIFKINPKYGKHILHRKILSDLPKQQGGIVILKFVSGWCLIQEKDVLCMRSVASQ